MCQAVDLNSCWWCKVSSISLTAHTLTCHGGSYASLDPGVGWHFVGDIFKEHNLEDKYSKSYTDDFSINWIRTGEPPGFFLLSIELGANCAFRPHSHTTHRPLQVRCKQSGSERRASWCFSSRFLFSFQWVLDYAKYYTLIS